MAALLAPAPAPAQSPPRLEQDALDLQARSNLVQGAGARAYGMGGAFLARPDDATAASWNPAGLSYLRSPEVSLVGTRLWLRTLERNISDELQRDERLSGNAPDFLAVTYPLTLGALDGAVQLSFQRVISFDGQRSIKTPPPQPDLPPTVRQFETRGGFDLFGLGAGLQATRRLRLGFALNRWLHGYSFTSERVGRNPTRQSVDFDLEGWNLNLGLIWSPITELNLGAVYKTGFDANVSLNRNRTDFGASVTSNQFQSSAVRLRFPAAFGVGASWRPSAPVTFSADYTRTDWSGGRIFEYFTLPQAGTPAAPEDLFEELPYPTLRPGRSQGDAEQLRGGVEYVVIKGGVKWPLRFGYFADRQVEKRFNEATEMRDQLPLYHGFTAGTGLIIGRVLVDLAYLFELGNYRDSSPEGPDPLPRDHSVRSQRLFVSLIYRHAR